MSWPQPASAERDQKAFPFKPSGLRQVKGSTHHYIKPARASKSATHYLASPRTRLPNPKCLCKLQPAGMSDRHIETRVPTREGAPDAHAEPPSAWSQPALKNSIPFTMQDVDQDSDGDLVLQRRPQNGHAGDAGDVVLSEVHLECATGSSTVTTTFHCGGGLGTP
jgi:hypothetical protein